MGNLRLPGSGDLKERAPMDRVPQCSPVPNGVEIREFSMEESSGAAPPAGSPVLVAAGRMVRQKGFDVLLEAAARSVHKPHIWLVGDGAERPRLETLAADLGIADRVRFYGRRASSEVRVLMAAADAVVVPSRVEAFGIVVLEAWASGTPVLATVRGGPATIVTDGHDGLLIDPEDVGTVVAAIDRIVRDKSLGDRLARAGSESVRSYTWGRVVDEYVRIYSRVTGMDRQFSWPSTLSRHVPPSRCHPHRSIEHHHR